MSAEQCFFEYLSLCLYIWRAGSLSLLEISVNEKIKHLFVFSKDIKNGKSNSTGLVKKKKEYKKTL